MIGIGFQISSCLGRDDPRCRVHFMSANKTVSCLCLHHNRQQQEKYQTRGQDGFSTSLTKRYTLHHPFFFCRKRMEWSRRQIRPYTHNTDRMRLALMHIHKRQHGLFLFSHCSIVHPTWSRLKRMPRNSNWQSNTSTRVMDSRTPLFKSAKQNQGHMTQSSAELGHSFVRETVVFHMVLVFVVEIFCLYWRSFPVIR
jgi:hypothetical protein